mmetsp:Transcript_34208/g.61422  ORF Transcript_34208/g.61422 Transcript_34208/m.61422 type:complete len:83 (-) Transcript_34208:118-366(-)
MREIGRGQQQHDDLGTDLSIGADLYARAAANIHISPDTIAMTPAFSRVQPLSQTPEAKNSMVMKIEKEQRRYNTVIRRHAFG